MHESSTWKPGSHPSLARMARYCSVRGCLVRLPLSFDGIFHHSSNKGGTHMSDRHPPCLCWWLDLRRSLSIGSDCRATTPTKKRLGFANRFVVVFIRHYNLGMQTVIVTSSAWRRCRRTSPDLPEQPNTTSASLVAWVLTFLQWCTETAALYAARLRANNDPEGVQEV